MPAQPAVWNDLVLAPPEVMISWLRNIFTARSTDCAGAVPAMPRNLRSLSRRCFPRALRAVSRIRRGR
jgi:hypothetical protein